MPFRYLLPMLGEVGKHQAAETLQMWQAARLAQADPKDEKAREILDELVEQSKGGPPDPAQQRPMSIGQIKAMGSVLGFEVEVR